MAYVRSWGRYRRSLQMRTTTAMIAALTSLMLAGFSSSTAGAQSACGALGGTVGPDQTCHAHIENDTYTVDFRFPVDYPDQGAMTDVLTQRRDDFIDWITRMPNTYLPRARRHRPRLPLWRYVIRHSEPRAHHRNQRRRPSGDDIQIAQLRPEQARSDHLRHAVPTRRSTDGGAEPNCPARVGQTRRDGPH